MAIFSGKVVSAQFLDPPNNMTIEVLYTETGHEELIPFVLEVDFTQQDFVDLLEEFTLEEIEENTRKQIEIQKKDFYSLVDILVEEKWKEEEQKIKLAYQQIDQYSDAKYKELDQYSDAKYKELDQYADARYKELDQYAEEEKLKKFEEVQEEFGKLRKTLQEKFSKSENSSLKDITSKDLLNIIESKNDDNDFVFNIKIAVLEDPIIAKSKNKSLKLNIRKAKTIWQLLKIYSEIKEAS